MLRTSCAYARRSGSELRPADTDQEEVRTVHKLLSTIAVTFAVVAVLPASAAAATAIEYGLIAAL